MDDSIGLRIIIVVVLTVVATLVAFWFFRFPDRPSVWSISSEASMLMKKMREVDGLALRRKIDTVALDRELALMQRSFHAVDDTFGSRYQELFNKYQPITYQNAQAFLFGLHALVQDVNRHVIDRYLQEVEKSA